MGSKGSKPKKGHKYSDFETPRVKKAQSSRD